MKNKKFKFHIHLPEGIEKFGQPVVLGDRKELGLWENVNVKLGQPYPENPTYWQSETIIISISNFTEANYIKYKLAIRLPNYVSHEREEKNIFEGNSPDDDRILDVESENQFAIWKNNFNLSQNFGIQLDNIQDYAFVDYIFKSIEAHNLKDKIIEYQHLLSSHNELTVRASNFEYIINHVGDKSRERRLFLCLLLGYHISRQNLNYGLPKIFPSELLLDAFDNYKQETLLSDIKVPMHAAITSLVQHNAFQYQFHWLKVFTIATEVDPEYIFIYHLEELKYPNDDLLAKFMKEMEIIFPYINIEFEIYVNLAKWLIQLCHNNDLLFKLWCDILLHNDAIDKSISKSFIDQVQKNTSNDDAVTLEASFERIPKSFQQYISGPFRNNVLQLLKNPFTNWTDSEISSIKKFLQNDDLNWRREDIIQSLESISRSDNLGILNLFPEILDDWFRRDFSDTKERRIPKISNHWFVNLLNKLDNNDTNESKFVFLIFQQLENVYPLLSCRKNIWQNLTIITTNRVKACSESQIIGSVNFIVQIKEQEVRELFSDIIKEVVSNTNQPQLFDKIFMMYDCKSKMSDVPNT